MLHLHLRLCLHGDRALRAHRQPVDGERERHTIIARRAAPRSCAGCWPAAAPRRGGGWSRRAGKAWCGSSRRLRWGRARGGRLG
jgi:hypothetical protein